MNDDADRIREEAQAAEVTYRVEPPFFQHGEKGM